MVKNCVFLIFFFIICNVFKLINANLLTDISKTNDLKSPLQFVDFKYIDSDDPNSKSFRSSEQTSPALSNNSTGIIVSVSTGSTGSETTGQTESVTAPVITTDASVSNQTLTDTPISTTPQPAVTTTTKPESGALAVCIKNT